MMNKISGYFLSTTLAVGLMACAMNTDPDTLPGESTATVNGEAWTASNTTNSDPISAIRNKTEKTIRIVAQRRTLTIDEKMTFALSGTTAGTYPLVLDSGNVAIFLKNNKTYTIDFTHTGNFNLTKVDEGSHRMSATFNFVGVADNGDTVNVTNGTLTNFRFIDQ